MPVHRVVVEDFITQPRVLCGMALEDIADEIGTVTEEQKEQPSKNVVME